MKSVPLGRYLELSVLWFASFSVLWYDSPPGQNFWAVTLVLEVGTMSDFSPSDTLALGAECSLEWWATVSELFLPLLAWKLVPWAGWGVIRAPVLEYSQGRASIPGVLVVKKKGTPTFQPHSPGTYPWLRPRAGWEMLTSASPRRTVLWLGGRVRRSSVFLTVTVWSKSSISLSWERGWAWILVQIMFQLFLLNFSKFSWITFKIYYMPLGPFAETYI